MVSVSQNSSLTNKLISRVDLYFSYWIFAWFLFYWFGFTRYNPKFAILLATMMNIILVIYLFVKKIDLKYISLFIIIQIVIKFIPYIFIQNTHMKKIDYIATIAIFIIYNIWVHINNTTFYEIMNHEIHTFLHEKYETPLMNLFYILRFSISCGFQK